MSNLEQVKKHSIEIEPAIDREVTIKTTESAARMLNALISEFVAGGAYYNAFPDRKQGIAHSGPLFLLGEVLEETFPDGNLPQGMTMELNDDTGTIEFTWEDSEKK